VDRNWLINTVRKCYDVDDVIGGVKKAVGLQDNGMGASNLGCSIALGCAHAYMQENNLQPVDDFIRAHQYSIDVWGWSLWEVVDNYFDTMYHVCRQDGEDGFRLGSAEKFVGFVEKVCGIRANEESEHEME
jgi:hypothetical protein